MVELDDLIVQKKVKIIEHEDPKKLYFVFEVDVNDTPRKVSILLFKKHNEHMDAINSICKALAEQSKLIEQISAENKELREKVNLLDKRCEEKEKEKIIIENDSIKGEKELSDYDLRSDLIRPEVKVMEHNNELAYIDPIKDVIGPCAPDEILENSKIFEKMEEFTLLRVKIDKNVKIFDKEFYNMKMIYRASEDGDTAQMFHKKCDKQSPILLLVKTTKNRRFGGFSQCFFESTNDPIGKLDDSAFIFSLNKLKTYDIQQGQSAICTCKDKGPMFYGNVSCNIFLGDNFFTTKGNVAKKGDRYKTTEDYEINFGKSKFFAKEVEIYRVYLLTKYR